MQATGVETEIGRIGAAESSIGDFVALMKPRVMSLVVFTALTGMVLAPGQHPSRARPSSRCSASPSARAPRARSTCGTTPTSTRAWRAPRPAPSRAAASRRDEALSFGTVLAVFSVLTLGLLVNWTAGVLLAFTIAFYVFVYTMWLKRRTPQNIVIGGAAGAFPPDDRLGRGHGLGQHRKRRCCSSSSSCGRRRTSGRWRSTARATTSASACRCCRWWRAPRDARQICSTRSLLVPLALVPAFIGLAGVALR